MARSGKQPELTPTEQFLQLGEALLRQAREPNILAYQPHDKQKLFHQADDYIRLYIGGNRSGKSYAAVVEDIWWATGTHPYLSTPPPPVRGRVVAVDLLKGVDLIILPLFKRLCAPSMLKGGSWEEAYSEAKRTLTFANGSTIEFMSYEMKTEKFAGTSRHFIHFDEEPPRDIYEECSARLVDVEGSAWISMTPVLGLTWVYEKLYKPVNDDPNKIVIFESEERGSVYRSEAIETTIIEVNTDDNPYLTERGKSRYFGTLDDDDREARKRGAFVQRSGLVFKVFDTKTHVIPPVPNPAEAFRGWAIYASVDHGWNNPTAWLWHAVAPDGRVVTFGEHYASEMTIAQHAQVVYGKEKMWGITPELRTGDPAMKQTSAITGTSVATEYSNLGIYLALDSVPRSTDIGLAKMQEYFRIRNGRPTWLITEDCVNFIRELKALHFKRFVNTKTRFENNEHEEIQKKDDHTYDSARYFATFLPDLTPIEDALPQEPVPANGVLDYDKALWRAHVNSLAHSEQTEWRVIERFDS